MDSKVNHFCRFFVLFVCLCESEIEFIIIEVSPHIALEGIAGFASRAAFHLFMHLLPKLFRKKRETETIDN